MRIHNLFLTMAAATLFSGGLMLTPINVLAQTCGGAAASRCGEDCGAAGVESCTKDGATVNCVCNPTTKDVKGNAFGTETQETEEGHGNLNDKTTGFGTFPVEECTGNQGQCKK